MATPLRSVTRLIILLALRQAEAQNDVNWCRTVLEMAFPVYGNLHFSFQYISNAKHSLYLQHPSLQQRLAEKNMNRNIFFLMTGLRNTTIVASIVKTWVPKLLVGTQMDSICEIQ